MHFSARQWMILVCVAACLVNLVSWLLVYFLIPAANAPFIIRYRISGTGDIFGSRTLLFAAPLTGLIILAVNGMMAYLVFEKERRFALILLGMTLMYQALVLAYSFILIRVNTY